MTIVSDTSPLSNLILVGLDELLPKIFKSVIIPETVYQEPLANGEQHLVTQTIQNDKWITICQVKDLSN